MKRLILPEFFAWSSFNLLSKALNLVVLAILLTSCSNMPTSSWFESTSEQAKPAAKKMISIKSGKQPTNIAVLLPDRGPFAGSANSIRAGILYAKQQDHRGSSVNIRFYDTEGASLASTYDQAVNDGAEFVIGPLTKYHVTQLVRTTTIRVPTLALNYTDVRRPAGFYEIGLMPEDEVEQMLIEARKAGLSRALLIAPQSAFGSRLTKPLVTNWQAKGGQLVDTLYFSANTNFSEAIPRLLHVNTNRDKELMKNTDRNKETLESQRRHDFDVIFLVTKPKDARTILPLLRYYYVNDVAIYAPSSVYAEPDPVSDVDLNGIHVCDIPANMQENINQDANRRLYALGQDAYLISQSISQLEQNSGLSLPGETGSLSLNNKKQIQREVNCGVMRNGHLSPA